MRGCFCIEADFTYGETRYHLSIQLEFDLLPRVVGFCFLLRTESDHLRCQLVLIGYVFEKELILLF